MKRPLYLAVLAPLALALTACGASSDTPAPEPTAAPAEAAATTSEVPVPTEAPAERTDFIVFIKEPEPLNVFTHDQLVCAPHSEVGDFLERPEAPRVQLYDGAGELLATQGLSDTGPVLDDLCSIHVKFLDIPVTDSYRVIFSGEDGDGNPYKFEGVTTFDKEKFDDGYTQSHTFELD